MGVERDPRVVLHFHHARRHDTLRAVEGGEGLRELRHVPADRRLLLDEDHLAPAVGDIERGLDPGDAATDHKRLAGHWHPNRFQGLVPLHLLHHEVDQLAGLLRGFLAVLMHPGALLADVGHLAQEGVEPSACHGPPEGDLVHVRAARRDDHAGEVLLPDRVLDQSLTRIGAHVAIVHGVHDPGEPGGELRHLRAIHRARDILTTMADKDTDASHREPVSFSRVSKAALPRLSRAGRALPAG